MRQTVVLKRGKTQFFGEGHECAFFNEGIAHANMAAARRDVSTGHRYGPPLHGA
jgi:hypothetical protein